jgi:hypothetical protein
MGIYDLKAACLACLRNVCNYQYTGNLATALKTLQEKCMSRRWAMESSMETEAGLVQWITELDAALVEFQKATKPERGRDGSVMPQHPDEDNLRAFVDAQIASCKNKALKMQALVHERTGTLAHPSTTDPTTHRPHDSQPQQAHVTHLLQQLQSIQ